ncbi:hypothetical protein SAMN04489725_10819 [Alicyclobacillus hesperidum]|uniref:Uncharacterized protein n=1 Tax=Alicyclobacillus hesperidum TaxID=89784 RepID=A0A1H2UJC9_9BACL|nr:hypothetical protein SAMN04489725_10819 [Alicyclobacillus hesperidum]
MNLFLGNMAASRWSLANIGPFYRIILRKSVVSLLRSEWYLRRLFKSPNAMPFRCQHAFVALLQRPPDAIGS